MMLQRCSRSTVRVFSQLFPRAAFSTHAHPVQVANPSFRLACAPVRLVWKSRRNMSSSVAAAVDTSIVAEAPHAAEERNPLLEDVVLPLWDKIETHHVVPGVKALLKSLHVAIDELEQSVQPSWEGLLEPLERISDRHQRVWGIVSHLKVRV